MSFDVIVLGGGMVGATTALALQDRNKQVALVDEGNSVGQSSFGNAGIIQAEAAEPYAMPRSMRELGAIALGRSNAVAWHAAGILRMIGPLTSYFLNSAPARHKRIARTYAKLTTRSTSDHAPLIEAAKADHLIRREGFRHAFHAPAELATAVSHAERLNEEYGVRFIAQDGSALAAREPTLKKRMAGAIHWLDPWTCSDPGALVSAYTELFRSRGGRTFRADAMTLTRNAGGWQLVENERRERIRAPDAVIALGIRSSELCRRFGFRVPLFPKRGYHIHVATKAGPELPFVDVSTSAVFAPMANGLRILTGAEIAVDGSKLRPVQLERATRAAAELFDLGELVDPGPWVGVRPCMPDMLPVVGALPGVESLWANFGHGHQGFTLGPTTATLLAKEMTGGEVAPSALAPARLFRSEGR